MLRPRELRSDLRPLRPMEVPKEEGGGVREAAHAPSAAPLACPAPGARLGRGRGQLCRHRDRRVRR
ncbi:hypothetical protein GW17_00021805 [Ensete ventricosum]|uniref:Uncharacterized protein n=1 Tax=Ensete ventricosum TaxID=4639 RepID=A0A444EVS7_ENSVE|nr:hypothetical protein GW17_00021805 [Ensete ventricosum]RZR73920.1 hypothetical protein BHM03_00029671 [Ensete ventricosum]